MTTFYAGIGSRATPPQILQVMSALARKLEPTHGLRSGGATGADQAFEAGVNDIAAQQIFLPDRSFQGRFAGSPGYINATALPAWQQAMATVDQFHWSQYPLKSDWIKKLMARNAMQVLGPDLQTPSKFVVAWTPGALIDGKEAGGTGQALRIARHYDIPIRTWPIPRCCGMPLTSFALNLRLMRRAMPRWFSGGAFLLHHAIPHA